MRLIKEDLTAEVRLYEMTDDLLNKMGELDYIHRKTYYELSKLSDASLIDLDLSSKDINKLYEFKRILDSLYGAYQSLHADVKEFNNE